MISINSTLILEYVRHRYLQVTVSDELSEAKGVLVHVTGRKTLQNLGAFNITLSNNNHEFYSFLIQARYFWSRCVTFWYESRSKFADLQTEQRIRILLYSSVAFKMPKKSVFLYKFFCDNFIIFYCTDVHPKYRTVSTRYRNKQKK